MASTSPQLHFCCSLLAVCLPVLTNGITFGAWSGSINGVGNDLWLKLNDSGSDAYDFRIGVGGALTEMRDRTDGFKPLLSPSFQGEATDRIIQWTIWSLNHGITNPAATQLPTFEQRYNVTQGGNFDGYLHETLSVPVDYSGLQVDVYSKADLQWKSENQENMQGTHSALTRYTFDDRGFIKIRRIVSVGEPTLNGVTQPWTDLYFEGWTPMRGGRDTFTAMALGLSAVGTPNWWYRHQFNIPQYPFMDVENTNGYAVVYKETDPTGSDAVGIVFGTKTVESHSPLDSYVLNSLDWNNGIGILPAIQAKSTVVANSIVDQTLYIVPRQGLSAEMSSLLTTLASEIPAPHIYEPNNIPVELEGIYATLMTNASVSGTSTDHLFPLVTSVRTQGDFDGDGDVDGADFLMWQRGDVSSPPSPTDLEAWQANYGSVLPLASANSVPEPTSVILLIAYVCLANLYGGRKHPLIVKPLIGIAKSHGRSLFAH